MAGWISYSFFVEAALKSTVVLSAAWLGVLALRGRSAAVRHVVWSAACAALLALPLLSMMLPSWRVPIAGSHLVPGFLLHADAVGAAQEGARQAAHDTAITVPLQSAPWLPGWPLLLTSLWAAGAAVSLGQMLRGWAAMERLRRRARRFEMPGFRSMTNLLAMEDDVELRETTRGSMPLTYGFIHPTIFMPGDAMEWSAERREVVLLHELAHVRRGDSATHLLVRMVVALYWWNPLVWVARRGVLQEQERAADDLVLSTGARASEYANHLLDIARSMQPPAALGWVAVPMARRSQLEGRLLSILDSGRDRAAPGRRWAVAALVAAIGITIPVAAVEAKSDGAPAQGVRQAGDGTSAFLLKEGDAAREKGKYDQAAAIYRKALAVLGSSGPEAATAWVHLGTVELATKNFAGAIKDFERAQASDSGQASEARMWTAIAQQRQNNLQAADGLYQSALSAEDPNSAAAATIMELYAALLQQQGQSDEANAMQKEAAVIRTAQASQARTVSHSASSDGYKIGGDVSAPVLVSKVEPEYTPEARIAKYQGTALLSVEIGPSGAAHNIQVVRALGFGLDEKAIAAISQWKFRPSIKDGQPVTVQAQIEVNFRLL